MTIRSLGLEVMLRRSTGMGSIVPGSRRYTKGRRFEGEIVERRKRNTDWMASRARTPSILRSREQRNDAGSDEE